MLSTFPGLFTYALVAPLLLRLALGGYFILQGIRRHKDEKSAWESIWSDKRIWSQSLAMVLARIEMVIGIFILIGLYTQIAAILALVFAWLEWYKRNKMARLSFQELWPIVFVSIISISLLFLGAGFLAFDLPL